MADYEDALKNIENALANVEDAVKPEWFAEVEYQGFNPKAARAILFARWTDKKNEGQVKATGFSFKQAIAYIVVYYIVRGTQIKQKFKENSTEKAKKVMNALIAILQIKENIKGASKAPDAISIGRLTNAFPDVVAEILSKYPRAKKVSKAEDPMLPTYLMFPGGISLIPLDKYENLVKAWEIWNMRYTKLVNPDKKDTEDAALVAEQRKYTVPAHNSVLFDDDKRIAILDRCKAISGVDYSGLA